MHNQSQKSQFTPLTYILVGVALMLAYLLLDSCILAFLVKR